MILGEFIGISFEQMRFLADNRISINTSMLIHVLAAPKFLIITLPYALLMANIVVYKELSRTSEIIAFRSFGISISKIVIPSIGLSILLASFSFCCQELIVNEANYRAAIILEQAMEIDRDTIVINDFVYSEFSDNDNEKNQQIELLLHAKQATNTVLKDITLLTFDRETIQKIIIARAAYWNDREKVWILATGVGEIINKDRQLVSYPFETHKLKLGNALNQLLTQARDNNELKIVELRKKVNIFKQTGHTKEVRELENIIHSRFALPCSCITFSLVGVSIGINLKPKSAGNEFGVGLVIILTYYILQAIDTTLIAKEVLPLWGTWIPNFLGIGFAVFRLSKFS
jgi:lipopolysaccharide export system permease protein